MYYQLPIDSILDLNSFQNLVPSVASMVHIIMANEAPGKSRRHQSATKLTDQKWGDYNIMSTFFPRQPAIVIVFVSCFVSLSPFRCLALWKRPRKMKKPSRSAGSANGEDGNCCVDA